MRSTEFCYWLQGMFELGKPTTLDADQTELIRRHLAMVFQHDIDLRLSPEEQSTLNAIHNPSSVNDKRPPGARC